MNSGGQNPCSVNAFYEVFKICFKVGKLRTNGALKIISVVASYLSEQQIDYHPISTKDQVRLHHRNSFQGEADEPDSAGQHRERDELEATVLFEVHQEASCVVNMFKQDVNVACHREVDVLFRSLSGGRILHRTCCQNVRLVSAGVDGDQVLLRAVDRFTLLNTTPPRGYMWSGWMLTELQATLSPKHIWPEICSTMSQKSQPREKQKWTE